MPGPTRRQTPTPPDPRPASVALLRAARRLRRRRERTTAKRFLAEGRQAVTEALAVPGVVLDLLVADDAVERHLDLVENARRAAVRVSTAAAAAVAEVSETVTPQGIIAICNTVDVPVADALARSPRLVVLCHQIRDPGNLGTVIRCADAFGADAVLISQDSVDLYNAKTVRASTGSLFHLPVTIEVDLADAVSEAREVGLQVFGADAAAPCLVDDLARSGELAHPVLWVLGNEARGLPAGWAAQLDRLVGLPMYGRAESLNLSTAAAVLLYATASAQRAASKP